jgi:hypothetical protein
MHQLQSQRVCVCVYLNEPRDTILPNAPKYGDPKRRLQHFSPKWPSSAPRMALPTKWATSSTTRATQERNAEAPGPSPRLLFWFFVFHPAHVFADVFFEASVGGLIDFCVFDFFWEIALFGPTCGIVMRVFVIFAVA